MISVENTTKRYGKLTAIEDVSFRCEPGTVTGFLGPNGAGKSTTLRIITGLTPATAGTTRLNGVPYRASQRTALSTFTLVPRRERVVVAKLVCIGAYGLLCVPVGLALAAAGNLAVVLLDRGDGSWALSASRLGTAGLFLVLSMVMGAFGMLLMNTPLAVVLYFMLPTIWSLLLMLPVMRRPAGWLELNRGLELLASDAITPAGWSRLGTAAALWVLLPTVLGVARLLRREVA